MAYADQQMSGNRIVAIIIVALIHVAVGYALVTGLAYEAAKNVVERLTTVDIDEPEPEPEEEPPPPPEPENVPPPPVAPPPPISIAVAPPKIVTQIEIPKVAAPVIPVAAPPPAPPSKARDPQPRSQRSWASRIQENYPPRALREGTEGTVGVTVTVGADGRVSSCRVTASSGSDVLDDAACKGMERYARFDPAWDAGGNPTSGSWATRIVYQLN